MKYFHINVIKMKGFIALILSIQFASICTAQKNLDYFVTEALANSPLL